MSTFQSLVFILFGIIIYMMSIDENVLHYLNLVFRLVRVKIRRLLWWSISNPENPLTRLTISIKYLIIAARMKNEFAKKSK